MQIIAIQPRKPRSTERVIPLEQDMNISVPEVISLEKNLELLKSSFPTKILFTIADAAEISNLSYEFIRSSIQRGKIGAVQYGDRKMIHVHELARIITEGIKCR